MKLLISLIFFLPLITNGQGKYFVYLKDKNNNTFSIERPNEFLSTKSLERRQAQNISITEKDLPVSPVYTQAISKKGFKIWGQSRWLNALLIEGNIDSLKKLDFVAGIDGNADIRGNLGKTAGFRTKNKFTTPLEPINYGTATSQIKMLGVDSMHHNGFKGKNILIAVLDAGFPNVNTAEGFSLLKNNIVKTFNYVTQNPNVYRDNNHGTNVLSIMASYLPGKVVGPAPEASFALYTTEDVNSETKLEEVNWLFAAENADSLGVDIISSSLGYYEFDDTKQNYTYQDMDGKSTIIVKAANQAIASGIIVVISAGNEGNTSWRYVSSPADGDEVIAVGAVNSNKTISSFSSLGPSADGRIKPDVSAMGVSTVYNNNGSNISSGNGTSYSAPLITGFLAGIKSQFPSLTAKQIRDILLKSADRFQNPDNKYGYGIPSYSRFVEIVSKEYLILGECSTCLSVKVYPNPVFNNQQLIVKVDGKEIKNETKIDLYDTSGKKIIENAAYGNLKLTSINSGIYFLNFELDNQTYTHKIYIQ